MTAFCKRSILVLPLLACCPLPCQADVPADEDTPPPVEETTRLLSEQEIWDYFEHLCEVQPTSRCYRDRVQRVREGEVLPAVPFEDENFFPVAEENMKDWIECKWAIRQMDGEPPPFVLPDGCSMPRRYTKPVPEAYLKTKAK